MPLRKFHPKHIHGPIRNRPDFRLTRTNQAKYGRYTGTRSTAVCIMRAYLPLCLALVAMGGVHQSLPSARAGTPTCVSAVITEQPQSQAVIEGCPVTFSVGVMGTGPFSYQWYRDGQAIPDATNSSHKIPNAYQADNGARFYATIDNECSRVISSEVTLQILLDVVPPRLLRTRGDASLERVIVAFSVGGCGGFPGLDPNLAQDLFNYTISGGIVVSNAQLEPNGTTVILSTSRQRPNTLYTLRVEGVSDLSGNVIPPGSESTFQSWVVAAGTDSTIVPPPVSLYRSGSDMWITWPYGSFLQVADDIAGPWHTLVGVDFPYPVTFEGTARFYRALFDP